jgi:hypothetical protein
MLHPFIRTFLSDPNCDATSVDDLRLRDIYPSLNNEIFSEENKIVAESVAALLSHPRGFDTGSTMTFVNVDKFEQFALLNQVYALLHCDCVEPLERAKVAHMAWCEMWLIHRIRTGQYLSMGDSMGDCMAPWYQLDNMRKRELVFIALAVSVRDDEDTAQAAERIVQGAVDVLLNEY